MKKLSKVFAIIMIMIMVLTNATPVEASTKKKLTVFSSVSGKTITVGKKVQLTVWYTSGSKAKTVTKKAKYKSSDSKVISVNKKGKLTAKKAGKATITVKYSGKSKKVTFKVQGKHKHVWKPNVVVEYEKGVKYVCNCGYVIGTFYPSDPITKEEISKLINEHCRPHLRNGEPDNYTNNTVYREVSHIDGYYCDCGAKKD